MRSYYEDQKKKKKIGGKKLCSGKGMVMKISTDGQSIAARERRHRISERFKILQSLVIPAGVSTKMDTVSMLEQAINYVKFLKTQIIWFHDHLNINNIATLNYNYDYDYNNLPSWPPADDHDQYQITTTQPPPLNVAAEADQYMMTPPTQMGLSSFPLHQSAAYYASYDQEY